VEKNNPSKKKSKATPNHQPTCCPPTQPGPPPVLPPPRGGPPAKPVPPPPPPPPRGKTESQENPRQYGPTSRGDPVPVGATDKEEFGGRGAPPTPLGFRGDPRVGDPCPGARNHGPGPAPNKATFSPLSRVRRGPVFQGPRAVPFGRGPPPPSPALFSTPYRSAKAEQSAAICPPVSKVQGPTPPPPPPPH